MTEPFTGLERHQIGMFQHPLLKRKETYEETLFVYDAENKMGLNKNVFSRTTHLYRNTADTFVGVKQVLEQDDSFKEIEIVHQASDLGLPYKVVATHSSGVTIHYDGLLFRVSSVITEDSFESSAIHDLAGYPTPFDNIIEHFGSALRTAIPHLVPMYHSTYSFYTIQETDWKALGVKPVGEAQVRMVCTDPNYVTITALIFSKHGKDYELYFGNRNQILEMLAHDFQIGFELGNVNSLLHQQLDAVNKIRGSSVSEFAAIIAPFHNLSSKHRQWNSVKDNLRSLLVIKDIIARADLLTSSMQEIIDNRWAYFNGPKQMWLPDEAIDHQTKVQHACTQFFEANLGYDKVEFKSTEPIEPTYVGTFDNVKKKLQILKSQLGETYDIERDLLTAFQTEFSIYAVWIAVVTLVVSLVISLFT